MDDGQSRGLWQISEIYHPEISDHVLSKFGARPPGRSIGFCKDTSCNGARDDSVAHGGRKHALFSLSWRKVFNFVQTISPNVFTVFEMVFWDDTRSEQLLDMRPASFARGTPNHAGRTWILSPQRLPD
jgi:hypothetical protein